MNPRALAGLLLATSLVAQSATTLPVGVQSFGSRCSATLSVVDTIVGTAHRLDFRVRNALPGKPVALLLGANRTSVLLPGGCRLLVAPGAQVNLVADATGSAAFGLMVPGRVVGRFYAQALPFDPATGVIRASQGLALDFRGILRIASVSPLSGAEGDLIVIRGSGFDPLVGNNCVFLAGESASAAVVQATRNQIVARIGAVPATAVGDVSVIVGKGSALAAGPLVLAGVRGNVLSGCSFVGSDRADAGLAFKVRASRNTTAITAAPIGPVGHMIRMTLPVLTSTTVRIESHFHWYNCTWADDDVLIAFAPGTTDSAAARWIAEYQNQVLSGRSATASANTVLFTSTTAPVERAFGALSVQ